MVGHIVIGPTGAAAQIPIIGDDLAQIGRAVSTMVNCSPAGVDLYVKALWHASPIFLMGALKPEMWDVDIGNDRHRKKRGRGLRFWFNILIAGEFQKIGAPDWALFRLGEAAQRIGWYLMVLDAGSDFVINWTTMVYQWNGCDLVPAGPWFYAHNENLASAFVCDGQWQTFLGIPWVDGVGTGPSPSPAAIRILQACYPRFSLTFAPKVWASTPDAHLTAVRIIKDQGNEVWGEWAPPDNGGPNVDGLYVIEPFSEVPANTDFKVQYMGNGGFMGLDVMDWYMWSAQDLPDAPLGPDP